MGKHDWCQSAESPGFPRNPKNRNDKQDAYPTECKNSAKSLIEDRPIQRTAQIVTKSSPTCQLSRNCARPRCFLPVFQDHLSTSTVRPPMKMNIQSRRYLRYLNCSSSLLYATALLCAGSLSASAQSAVQPYAVSVFAKAPAGLTNPDSITVVHGDVYVSYANASLPDGTSGNSTVVQFDPHGNVLHTYPIVGKNDGLKYDPDDGHIWALRNEDVNAAIFRDRC
jgi:hypothetical protein